MRPANIVFWSLVTLLGVWLQNLVPGVDFLAPGLILAMQEEKWTVPVWLGFIWLFIHEGTGSMPLGPGFSGTAPWPDSIFSVIGSLRPAIFCLCSFLGRALAQCISI